MVISIKHSRRVDVKIVFNNTVVESTVKNEIDDFIVDTFNLDNCNTFKIITFDNTKRFSLIPFRKNWFDYFQAAFLSVDYCVKKQEWCISCIEKRRAKASFLLKEHFVKDASNGYVKFHNLICEHSTNVNFKQIATSFSYKKDIVLLTLLMLLNQIPLVIFAVLLLIIDLCYSDVFFRSGTIYVFIIDIPVIIVSILYFARILMNAIKIKNSIYKNDK